MRMSQTVIRPDKNPPKDAATINHRLLVQAGFVRQLTAGIYTYLPWGLRVLRKIEQVVREEMNAIGGEELLMPMLHPAGIWKQSGGWDSIDVLYKLKSRTGKEYALGQSQEEVVTPLMSEFINSYKDLPRAVYHIQWKFRDELRAKSGILRGREFYMKDMYSWHESQEDFEKFYEEAKKAYLKIFSRLGLVAKATEASGGSFSDKISYEFEVLTEAGEANILYCDECEFCVNVDDIGKYDEGGECPSCGKGLLKPSKAAEVGNIFDLGEKYVKAFGLQFSDQEGKKRYPVMGCYGIGISRTMGVIVERFNDERGIVWPESVAPFMVSLVSLGVGEKAEEIYQQLVKGGVEVLWDDREESAGVKFADADLIGNPYRVVVSERTLADGEVEIKRRDSDTTERVKLGELVDRLI
ncbi:aminoacyl--tRNA ligase-related protein [Candidatus Chazhemtobacterium aquaticus]|uniref:Proline--tRNA ligase n=1 Tax=Candidatus Chazhemtobacterium aquaticus TaxID=2715735 RepID=A0A857NGT2_9BACT|nr:aminoacyl--tRNA ligase-related protein [Candidatus Chazhemtobacterium aquaticus]QHO63378.1 Prolyl-tRNA synthetase, bacterial type [Candidatus Chazhemtobacterium aquaticus]